MVRFIITLVVVAVAILLRPLGIAEILRQFAMKYESMFSKRAMNAGSKQASIRLIGLKAAEHKMHPTWGSRPLNQSYPLKTPSG
jgi:hypothetical protein